MDTEPPVPNPKASLAERRRRWRRIAGWTVLAICVVSIALFTIATILLHSPRFHHYLLRLAETKAADTLGTQVRIDTFTIHPSSLSVDIYGVTVQGAKPHSKPALLEIPHLAARVRIVSVLSRKWYLENLQIDHPVARIFMDANGISNIPKPRSNGTSSHLNLFDIGIRHVWLNGGEVEYNSRAQSLNADLRDVQFQSTFDTLRDVYTGRLGYTQGDVRFGNFRPVRHNLDLSFTATRTALYLTQTTVSSGSSHLALTATVTHYSHPVVDCSYRAVIDGNDLRRILRNSQMPGGTIHTVGTLEYRDDPGVPTIKRVTVIGKLEKSQLDVKTSKLNIAARSVTAKYSVSNGNLIVNNLRAQLLNGALSGNLTMHDIVGARNSDFSVKLHGISLARLQQSTFQSLLQRKVVITGIVDATANARWNKSPRTLAANFDATIRADLSHGSSTTNTVPVTGSLRGTWHAISEQLVLNHSYLQTPQSRFAMNGSLSQRSDLAITLHSSNLADVENLVAMVRTQKPGEVSAPISLGGEATFTGSIFGPLAAPQIQGTLVAHNVRVKNTQWLLIQAHISASPSVAEISSAHFDTDSGGKVKMDARIGLTHWSFTQSSSFRVDLHAAGLDAADLTRLTGLRTPVAGALSVSLLAHGSELDPAGHGTVLLRHGFLYGQPVPSAQIDFTASEGQIHGTLNAKSSGGTLHGSIDVRPRDKTYLAAVQMQDLQLSKLQTLKDRHIDVRGLLSIRGQGSGSIGNPQFSADLTIPTLEIDGQDVRHIQMQTTVVNHEVAANVTSSAIGTSIHAEAKLNLSGNYPIEASLDTRSIPLQPIFAFYFPSQASQLSGNTEIHATLRGPLKNRASMQAQVTIPTLQASYRNTVHLAAVSPIHLDYSHGALELKRTSIKGTDTDLQIQGTIPMQNNAPASVLLVGTVNLQLAQLLNPDIQSSGELKLNINSYGARSDPNVEGRINVVNASFASGNLPAGVSRANGVLILTKDRLNIESFSASIGGGTVTAQGGIAYRPGLRFDLAAAANGVRILYPQGMREDVSANVRLSGTQGSSLLAGRVLIDNMSFTPDFDLASFADQLSGGVNAPPSQGFAENMQLNIAVNSTNNLDLVSRTLSVDGTANLQVRGTAANPVILGRINLTDGDAIFNNKRFTLSGGTVEFVNPSETQPILNLALNTTIQQYNIHLRFNGPIDRLRTNYSSDPALPSADIINLLAFGQTTEYSAANPTPGDQAAVSAVASQVSSQITSRVAKVAGISQLSINPVLAGGSTQGPAGAIVTIQQRVTGNLFVTFSTNVTSTQNQVIMGQYKISPRVSVSVTRDQNGGVAADVLFKKKW